MTYREHFLKTIKIAWPVMLSQAGQVVVNIADNIMVGGLGGSYDTYSSDVMLGVNALGAVSLGNSVLLIIMSTAFGFSFGMSPLIAQADVKNRIKRGAQVFSHGLLLNMGITIALLMVLFQVEPLLYHLDQSPEVLREAIPYIKIAGYSIIPLMIFQSLRQLSEGLSLTLNVAVATILANVLNVFFNYALIYGNWGMPRMGVEGAAMGTLFSRIFLIVFLLVSMWMNPKTRKYMRAVSFKIYNKYIITKLVKLGAPTAMQMFFEMGVFSAAAFICGLAGRIQLAAHQVALSLASTFFMLCIGISTAATIRIGNQYGLKDIDNLKKAGKTAFFIVVCLMGMAGTFIVLTRHLLPGFYNEDAQVISVASQLLIVVALFELSDGLQVVALGSLRGMQDVNIPTIITLVAYLLLALPLGYYLAIPQEMGALGMWIGLGIGLLFSAIALVSRFYIKTSHLKLQN